MALALCTSRGGRRRDGCQRHGLALGLGVETAGRGTDFWCETAGEEWEEGFYQVEHTRELTKT